MTPFAAGSSIPGKGVPSYPPANNPDTIAPPNHGHLARHDFLMYGAPFLLWKVIFSVFLLNPGIRFEHVCTINKSLVTS